MACRLTGVKPLSEPVLEMLLIGPLGTNFSEIAIKIHTAFSLKKMHLKTSPAKRRPFCLGLNVLRPWNRLAKQSWKAYSENNIALMFVQKNVLNCILEKIVSGTQQPSYCGL